MRQRVSWAVACAAWGWVAVAADVRVGRDELGSGFTFAEVPRPSDNDAATAARFSLVDGEADANSGGLEVLHDGRCPSGEDQPRSNFFFRAGTDGGRVLVDLGRVVAVGRVAAFSWHGGSRAPQVFALFGATGLEPGFAAAPRRPDDPAKWGWKALVGVDTRPRAGDGSGGQFGVDVSAGSDVLGSFRYLLFDVRRTEDVDAFGNTFFSEIDVVDARGAAPTTALPAFHAVRKTAVSADGAYRFVIDATEAPDLAEWSERTLAPLLVEWYPKIVGWLPSDGWRAPSRIALRFREGMGGTPASASGQGVNLNAAWFRKERAGEGLGAVVHELVHVVQGYGQARLKGERVPGWLVEGTADYIRWFRYEPEKHGADITVRSLATARYDGSYRVSANFLNWASQSYDRELVRALNAAAREGRYSESLWEQRTGKTLAVLGDEWRSANAIRLSAEKR